MSEATALRIAGLEAVCAELREQASAYKHEILELNEMIDDLENENDELRHEIDLNEEEVDD